MFSLVPMAFFFSGGGGGGGGGNGPGNEATLYFVDKLNSQKKFSSHKNFLPFPAITAKINHQT